MKDMTGMSLENFTLYCDNQGAMALSKNPAQHQRSKHIDIKFHFVRDEIQSGSLEVNHVPSAQNVADISTKPVSRVKGEKFRALLMGN